MAFIENDFARLTTTLGVLAACGAVIGCVLLTDRDQSSASQGGGGSSVSSSSSASGTSSTSSATGGSAGSGGAPSVCRTDGDCPGITNGCGKPRCFSDGLCGFDNEPIGAACTENEGHACDGKGQCVECTANEHCTSGKCGMDRRCIPPTCGDEIKNGDESDIDCGGSCPAHCGPLAICRFDADCAGGDCAAGICAPTCTDRARNGSEADVDCGGATCSPCELGKTCQINADCSSASCDAGICVPIPTCTDMVKNGAETDMDCGGPDCGRCSDGRMCAENGDCSSLSCVAGICAPPTCDDGVQNGGEVATDCGSTCALGCPPGTACGAPEDCASQKCEGPEGNTVCGEPSCFDGIWNGDETFYDCGGSCVNKCPPAYPCLVNTDCRGGLCDPILHTCTPTCTDGYMNQGETDPDCGGPCPKKCPEGWHCLIDADCVTGLHCTQGHCLP